MKIIFYLMLFLGLLGCTSSFADSSAGTNNSVNEKVSPLPPAKIVHDEKYGDISERAYIYQSRTPGCVKTATLNLEIVYLRSQKFRDYENGLRKEGEQFYKVRDGLLKKYNEAKKDSSPAEAEQLKNDIINFDRKKHDEVEKHNEDKIKEVMLDIQKAVVEYSDKNQLRAVYISHMPKFNEKVDINYEIIPKLSEHVDITNEIISILNSRYLSSKT